MRGFLRQLAILIRECWNNERCNLCGERYSGLALDCNCTQPKQKRCESCGGEKAKPGDHWDPYSIMGPWRPCGDPFHK